MKFRIYLLSFSLAVAVALAGRALFGAEGGAEKYFKEGFGSIQRGDFAEAQAQIEAGLKIDPRSPAGYDLLGIAFDGRSLFKQAEAAYRRALELNPRFVAAHNDLGRSLYRQGKADDAASEFARALRIEPKNFTASFNLGVISLEAKNYLKAAKYLEVAASQAPSDPQTLFALTRAYLGAAENDRALAVSRRLATIAPEDTQIHFSLGGLFLEWKLYAHAVDELERARISEPRNFELLYNLGQAYKHVQKYSEAEEAFLHALSIQDDSVETLYQLAVVYVESKHPDEAIQILVRARRLAPERPDVLLLLGRECIQEGFIEDAVGVLEDCVRIDPRKVEPHLLLGEALTKDKQFPRALREYETVAALEPRNPRSYVLLARTLWYAGQRQESEGLLRKALDLDPRNVEAAYYLGLFASNEANYPLAEKWLKQALKYDPQHFGALYEMGTTYMRAHDYVRARDYLERARAESPMFSQIHYRLAGVYRQLGDAGRAAESLELFKKYDRLDAQRRTYPQGLLEFVNETENLPDRQRLERYRAALLKAEEKNRDDPGLLLFLARVFLELGQKREALQRLRKIPSLAPDSVQARLRAASLLASYHDYPEAAEALEAFLKQHPGAEEARLPLASIYFETRHDEQALQILSPSAPGSDASAASHNLMGRLASRAGDSARALQELRRAVELEPRNEDYVTDLALELACARRMEESRGLLEKARKDFPASGRIFFAEGVWHQVAGHRSQSEGAFRQAADLSWQWQAPYLAQGNMLRELGSPKDALEKLSQAEALFTTSPWPHWLKALALAKSGANSESQSEFTRAQDLAPNEPEIFPALLASSLRRGDCGAAREMSAKMAAFGFASEIEISRWCGESANSAMAPGPALEKVLAPYSELKLLVEMAREDPTHGIGPSRDTESSETITSTRKSSPE